MKIKTLLVVPALLLTSCATAKQIDATEANDIANSIAEKYEVAPNTVLTALRKKNLYCGKSNPLCQEGVDEFLKSL